MTRRPVGLAVVVALTAFVVSGVVMPLIGGYLGLGTNASVDTMIASVVIAKAALSLLSLLLITQIFAARATRAGASSVIGPVLGGAIAAGIGASAFWEGLLLVTQVVIEPGFTSALADALLWSAVAGLGVVWGTSVAAKPNRSATPYG